MIFYDISSIDGEITSSLITFSIIKNSPIYFPNLMPLWLWIFE